MAYAWNNTMGAPSNYDQWVSYHQQAGTYQPDDVKRRDAYRAYAVARGLPTPWVTGASGAAGGVVASTPPPDFNRMDVQGTADLADAGSAYTQATGRDPITRQQVLGPDGKPLPGAIQSALDTSLANIGVGRANEELGYATRDRGVKGRNAGRGMFNSGMRRFAQARNVNALRQAMGLYDQQQTNAWNEFNRNNAAAESAFTNAGTRIPGDAATRNMQTWWASRAGA